MVQAQAIVAAYSEKLIMIILKVDPGMQSEFHTTPGIKMQDQYIAATF